jgi:hypothetical protein
LDFLADDFFDPPDFLAEDFFDPLDFSTELDFFDELDFFAEEDLPLLPPFWDFLNWAGALPPPPSPPALPTFAGAGVGAGSVEPPDTSAKLKPIPPET